MNYSGMTTNAQRLHIAAYGFEKKVTPDPYDMQMAMSMSSIASDAHRSCDPAKSTLAFAVFLKAARMAGLKPEHIVRWLDQSHAGQRALADYARTLAKRGI